MVEEINGSTTTAYHFLYDGNGNVTEVTDLNGNPAASYRYDAFGNTLVSTGSYANVNRYRFSTKPLDGEVTNAPLYYYGYRYYDPVTGRWPSRDPIEEEGGVNLYGFVGNNSISVAKADEDIDTNPDQKRGVNWECYCMSACKLYSSDSKVTCPKSVSGEVGWGVSGDKGGAKEHATSNAINELVKKLGNCCHCDNEPKTNCTCRWVYHDGGGSGLWDNGDPDKLNPPAPNGDPLDWG
jgi:RHS repeat-associated protein